MPSSRARRPSSTSSSDGEQPNCSPAWEAFDDVLRLLSRSLHDAQDVATDVAMQMCQAGGGMPQVVKRDHKALHDGCKVRAGAGANLFVAMSCVNLGILIVPPHHMRVPDPVHRA